jgi:hypothetical protein
MYANGTFYVLSKTSLLEAIPPGSLETHWTTVTLETIMVISTIMVGGRE